MRRNNFSSAADRRWQRRYERIQQRRGEELERRGRRCRDEVYETISPHDLGIDALIASIPTFTVTIQRPGEPNRNGSVISEDVWDAAWTRHMQEANRRANESRRSLSDAITAYIATDENNAEERSQLWHRIRDLFYQEARNAYEARRVGEEVHEKATEEFRGHRAQTMVVDDYFSGTLQFRNGDYIIIDDLVPAFEQEPDLKPGDASELDSFLGNFLAPGA